MASALSDDEFQRMQTQLLELRTSNYQLDEQCQRQAREFTNLKTHAESLDREYQKAAKALSKSKKAREVEALMQENDGLQRKLMSQEEEFRLQNETLMQELTSLVKVNENLEKENSTLKEGGTPQWKADSEATTSQDELRRIQAQNSALQKNLTSCQERYEQELSVMRQTISDLETQCVKLSGQRGTPVGGGDRDVEGESDPDIANESMESKSADDSLLESDTSLVNKSLDQSRMELHNLSLSLETEKEEKKILRDQLLTVEDSLKGHVKSLQDDNEKLSEKFKKKQESLVQLQEEKEKIFSDLSLKLEQMESNKDQEINRLKEQFARIQEDLTKNQQALEQNKRLSDGKVRELEEVIESLRSQVNAASAENNQQLSEQNQKFQNQLHDVQGQLSNTIKQRDDIQIEIQEKRKEHEVTLQQLSDTQSDRDKQVQALEDATKVAEKRKSLLDELAIKYQKESDQHREAVKALEEKCRVLEEDLKNNSDELRRKTRELEKFSSENEEIKAKVQGLDNSKGWLERRLNETEESLENTKGHYESMISTINQEHEDNVDDIKEEHAKKIQEREEVIEEWKTKNHGLDDDILKLKQDIKDGVNEKKIHEKKGASMLKDLKRQLQAERKRAEKLQERLQEVLSDNKNRQSMEELFKPSDPNDRVKGDNSSISSWSFMSSQLGRSSDKGERDKDSSSPHSPGDEVNSSGATLEQENNDLLNRLAELQTESWTLEEKVAHLESSNAAMADDLLRKTAIIEHYVMDSRIDHMPPNSPSQDNLTLKKVVDFIKDRGDENMKDINRKLQRMLEETLTKNMHLQQDLETLSQEVVRLSKVNSPVTTPCK